MYVFFVRSKRCVVSPVDKQRQGSKGQRERYTTKEKQDAFFADRDIVKRC